MIESIFEYAEKEGASDIQITAGTEPFIKVKGRFIKIESFGIITNNVSSDFAFSLMKDAQIERLKKNKQVDISFGRNTGRYRANIYYQRESLSISLRKIKTEISSIEELRLPLILKKLIQKKSGILIVSGPVGSGKSTTIASLIKEITTFNNVHIVTLEDPIEYLIPHNNSCIDQREIGTDVLSFEAGMQAILRENPDVIMIGELRDENSAKTAIDLADTGHLVLTTMHSFPVIETVSRMLSFFQYKEWLRKVFAMNFIAILTQRLVMSNKGYMVPAYELLLRTDATQSIIIEGKLQNIYNYFDKDKGMITLKDSLGELKRDGHIDSVDSYLSRF